MTRYVRRDKNGVLDAHYANPQSYAQEALPDDHPDIVAFNAKKEASRKSLNIELRLRDLEDRVRKLEG